MLSLFKRYFTMALILIVILSNVPSFATEWYEGGNLHEAKMREWKKASQQNKLSTCAGIISVFALNNYLKLPIKNIDDVKSYATQLLGIIDFWANSNGTIDDNEMVYTIALLGMLHFDWIDENFFNSLSKEAKNKLNAQTKKDSIKASTQNENANTKTTTQTKSSHKVIPKPKLMSKKAGKEWVKKNVHLRLYFPLDDMTARLGNYENKTISNIERYYFPRINMTFFVIKSSQEFIGFSESKPSH